MQNVYESLYRMYTGPFLKTNDTTFCWRVSINYNKRKKAKKLKAKKDSLRSDTFAKHFQSHFPKDATPQQIRSNVELSILWEGDPLSCVKTFQQAKCRLCTNERLHILYGSFNKKVNLMNRRSEIYGACCHKPKFHRFLSTDDSKEGWKSANQYVHT